MSEDVLFSKTLFPLACFGLIVLLAWFCLPGPLLAQPGVASDIRVLGEAQGLASDLARSAVVKKDGTIYVACMAPQGVGEWLGIDEVKNGTVTCHFDDASGLRSKQVSALLLDLQEQLFAATPQGLHELTPEGRFRPIGKPLNVDLLSLGKDGSVWGIGESDDRSVNLVRLEKETVRKIRWPREAIRPHRLFVENQNLAWVFCQNGIIKVENDSAKLVPLKGTPLWRKPRRDPDGPIQSVLLYDATRSSTGELYAIGHTKALTRLASGTFTKIADGHFSRLAPIPASSSVFVADFSGHLWLVSGFRCFPGLHGSRWDDCPVVCRSAATGVD